MMEKLATMSKAELEDILSNEDKISAFALESDLIKSMQSQRDQGQTLFNLNAETNLPQMK